MQRFSVRASLLAAALVAPALSWGACAAAASSRADVAPRDLYRRRCSACHVPRDPARYDFATLNRFLDRFAWRAGVTDDEKPIIREFLKSSARDAAPVAAK